MIIRAILGLGLIDKRIKIKDGKEQSILALFYWKGANEEEKSKFRELCSEFKMLHLQIFPNFRSRNKSKGKLPIRLEQQSPYNVHDNYYQFHFLMLIHHSEYKHIPKFKELSVNMMPF